jgi:hypothetical protein
MPPSLPAWMARVWDSIVGAWAWRHRIGAVAGGLIVLALGLLLGRALYLMPPPDDVAPGVIEWVLMHNVQTGRGDDSMEAMPEVEDDGDDGVRPWPFLYCHALGPPSSADWLSAKRAELRATTWAEEFSDARCAMGRAYLDAWAAWSNGTQIIARTPGMISALSATTRQAFETTWAPRVTRVLVDARGDLYLRLVVYDPVDRGFRARIVMLRALLRVLEAYRLDRHVRLAARLSEEPCICPAHFGIMGSGMHFTQEAGFCPQTKALATRRPLLTMLLNTTDSVYRVLLNVRQKPSSGADAVVHVEVPFREATHGFVFGVNALLWPGTAPRLVAVAAKPTRFEAHDPLPLFVPETVQRYGVYVKTVMLRHPLDNATIISGSLVEDEQKWFRFIARTGVRPLNLSRPLIDIPLDTARSELIVEGPSYKRSPQCVAYCAALEARLFAAPAETDMPLTIAPPAEGAAHEEAEAPAVEEEEEDVDEEEAEEEMDKRLLKLIEILSKKTKRRP